MHLPVLLKESIENLITDPQGIYVDCTLGGGGHLQYLLARLSPDARIIGIDKDLEVLSQSRERIGASNLTLVQSDFRNLTLILQKLGIDTVDGILMDLGVSSFQLDIAERGFSFQTNAPLDMRMNREDSLTARDIVNSYEEKEIKQLLYQYGEEAYAANIARAIVKYRSEKAIETTLELVDIIKGAVPAKYRREKHPAKKSFQALRIAVNSELDALREALPQATEVLKTGGRLCIISFHSLEDRIVKHFMQEKSRSCVCPPDFPICICNQHPQLRVINRKPIMASVQECTENSRARSARLRVAARI